ncbi:MAG: aminotransferase class V-fold PLP-dependent enzyme [Thermoplasmataceae archaeon]
MINAQAIKKDFPIFNRKIGGKPIIYLDNAATTQKPRQVVEAIVNYYYNFNSNIHRGIYRLSEEATDLYEKSRENVQEFIGAGKDGTVVFVRNATEALNLVASEYSRNLKPGDEVILSTMEHHSNLVPWQFLQEKGVVLKFVDLTPDWELNLEQMKTLLTPRAKVVSITHVSNVLGTINPVREIGKMAHENSAKFVLDGAQSVPHMSVDVSRIGCDFMAFSGHKMLGPSGIGGLYAKKGDLDHMHPYMGGGEMINQVWKDHATWNEVPQKFEAGTPNIEGAVGLSAAVDYLRNLGMENVRSHERDLIGYALELEEELKIPGLRSYGPRNLDVRGGVYTFNIGELPTFDLEMQMMSRGIRITGNGIHPHDVAQSLDRNNIAVRSGHHCAMPLMSEIGVAATSRASFYIYNTREDVEKLFEGIRMTERTYAK